MSLTYDEKVGIAESINVIFNDAVHATPEQITEEVAEMVTTVINEIANCSKRIETLLNEAHSIFYKRFPIQIIIGKAGKTILKELLEDWLSIIYKNFATRVCTRPLLLVGVLLSRLH